MTNPLQSRYLGVLAGIGWDNKNKRVMADLELENQQGFAPLGGSTIFRKEHWSALARPEEVSKRPFVCGSIPVYATLTIVQQIPFVTVSTN